MAPQPGGSKAGKAQDQSAAPARIERRRAAVAQQYSTERVRHHQATFFRNQDLRKVVWNREKQTIGEIAVDHPLAIGAKIGDRVLDLDDHDVTGLSEPEDIGAAPVGERKFDEAGIAELVERAADTPREQRGGRCSFSGRR